MLGRSLQLLRRHSPNWRYTFVSGTLLVTMTVTMIAAYQLHASMRDHDEAVDQMLVDYARYASRTFGEAVLRHGLGTTMEVLAAPTIIPAEGPGRGMTLDEFAEHARRALRRHDVGEDSWNGYFRFDIATGAFAGAGSALRPDVAEAASAILHARLGDGRSEDVSTIARFEVGDEPLSLAFTMQRTRAGDAVDAFGFVASRRHISAAQSRWVLERVPLFPDTDRMERVLRLPTQRDSGPASLYAPPVVSSAPMYDDPSRNDELLSIEFFDHQGRLLYETPWQFRSGVQGEFTFRTQPGGFTIRSTLSPAAVEQLRALHRPDRSRHYALLLPFISVILGTSAFVHLLRERELVRTRRNFVASVSHELRTPLAQIQIMAETLLRGRERSDDERMRWLNVIAREAYRMGGLVENILMFSHLERDELRLAREDTDLAELVRDVLEVFAPLAAARHARVVTEIPEHLVADVDPRAIRQVLGNLIDNALKYGPEGQVVRVAAMPAAEGQVLVSVTDQGTGVKQEHRQSIWQPFTRLNHVDGSAGGSGLGLAVVSSVVAHHGGTAFVDDAPGGGARFVVTLPLVGAPRPVEPSAVPPFAPAGLG